MDQDAKNNSRRLMVRGIIVYAILFLAVMLMINLEAVNSWLLGVLRLLRPILIGLALAYLLNPFFRFFERRAFSKLRPMGVRRAVALICSYLTLFLIVALVLLLILPQLIQSFTDFANEYEHHVSTGIAQFNHFVDNVNGLIERVTGREDFFAHLSEKNIRKTFVEWFGTSGGDLLDKLSQINVKPITDVLGEAMSAVADLLFGFFISLYLLSTKEKRYAQIMKLRRALFGNNTNRHITEFCRIVDHSFGGFIQGKLLDSLIIGVLTFAVVSIVQIPYALLIAAFVGVTNIIPVIGPFLGAVPTSFILLLTDPGKVIPFLIIILIIQQLDGNVIGPKILGNNTGVSSLCVVIAIVTMGSLWGLIGMLLGVPLFAAALELTEKFVVEQLQKKGMPSGLENYYASDASMDATKNAYSTTDKALQKFERKALHLQKKQEQGLELTQKERRTLRRYSLARKYHILNELSDEDQARLAAEDAAEDAEQQAYDLVKACRMAKNAGTAPEEGDGNGTR
jgi:predicted PurR-regulated permease PerM